MPSTKVTRRASSARRRPVVDALRARAGIAQVARPQGGDAGAIERGLAGDEDAARRLAAGAQEGLQLRDVVGESLDVRGRGEHRVALVEVRDVVALEEHAAVADLHVRAPLGLAERVIEERVVHPDRPRAQAEAALEPAGELVLVRLGADGAEGELGGGAGGNEPSRRWSLTCANIASTGNAASAM